MCAPEVKFARLAGSYESDTYFYIEHASLLTKLIANAANKWKEIGIALKLPNSVLQECDNANSNIVRLYRVLCKWIVGGYLNAVRPTLQALKHVLAGRLVQ